MKVEELACVEYLYSRIMSRRATKNQKVIMTTKYID